MGKSLVVLSLFLFFLSACQKTEVPTERPDHVPKNISHSGQLPSGAGGHKKIGKPYRVGNQIYRPLSSSAGYDATGVASWYGKDFHGKKTANGEHYDMHALSAAHPTLPLPTMVRVSNLENGRSVVVRVNDRGPFVKNRLIDLSYSAAKALGFTTKGTSKVRVQALNSKVKKQPISQLSSTATSDQTGVYVQVGAFSSHDNAKKLRLQLQKNFSRVAIKAPHQGTQKWYRVRIGPIYDSFEVERTILSLQGYGHVQSIVVTE